jgi:hypothetical protein
VALVLTQRFVIVAQNLASSCIDDLLAVSPIVRIGICPVYLLADLMQPSCDAENLFPNLELALMPPA